MAKLVMIVEDDPFTAEMYQTKLTDEGYKVTVRNNGRDAYDAIKSGHYDLVMLDLNLPEVNGWAVLDALRSENVDLDQLPIVIMTNSGEKQDQEKAAKMGIDYLIKADTTPKQVLELIKQKLGDKTK